MKFTTAVAALTATSITSTHAFYFSVIAARSGSPIHLQPLDAAEESLWIGKPTASYCPRSVVGKGCPKGKTTNFAGTTDAKTLGMGTVVPGGQQVYIDHATGAVKYTVAHSGAIPEGDLTGGWLVEPPQQGGSFGDLGRKGGLFACPVGGNEDGPWQIFAGVKGVTLPEACLGFDALLVEDPKADAWQYE